ncbi:MAG: PorV/PorQ family protein [candidate division Zixibacteria bacterium]|nr:PorV/PorQ family protein [candidate division Zixibacteria bacterium]
MGYKKILSPGLLILFPASFAFAKGGETTATFLTLGVGGRPSAMGEAYAGLAEGVNALAYNPAGVANLEAAEVSAMHAEWVEGIRYEYVAFVYPVPWGTLGADVRALTVGELELRTDPANPSEEPEGFFSATDIAVGLNYARPLRRSLGVGAGARLISQKIYNSSAVGVAGDLGLYWTPDASLSAGLAARNLGPPVTFEEKSSPLPMAAEIGLGYRLLGRKLILSAATEKPFKDEFLYKGGVEYNPFAFLSGRVGYIYGLDVGGSTGLTSGLGVNVAGFSFDFAMAPYGDLGLTYRGGFTYVFGRERRRIMEEVAAEFEERKRGMIASLSAKAEGYYREGNYQGAVDTWDLILVWDPENAEAAARLEEARERLNEELVAEHVGKAEVFFAERKCSEAALEYALAKKIDPTNAAALAGLARAEEELAREEARQKEEVAKLLEQARAAYSRGEYLTAIARWEAVLELEPENAEATANLEDARARVSDIVAKYKASATRFSTAGDWAAALSNWRRALRLAPDDDEAAAGAAKARAVLAREAQALVKAGISLYERGDLNGAEAKMIAALNLQPDNANASAYLVKIKKKRAAGKRAVANYTAIYMKGIEAYTNHQYRAAIAYWQQIPAKDSLYRKAQTNIKRAKAVLKELE